MVVLLALVGITWLTGFVFLWRVPRCTLDPQKTHYPRFSIIIPARNEEQNLQTLLPSLAGQDVNPEEVIVVDDHSQDHTAEIARRGGAKVIASCALPPGWLGKAWACQQGAEQAAGEVLIFLDADTILEPGGLRRILDTLGKAPGALSLSPFHRTRTWQEQVSAYFNIMQIAGVSAFTLFGDRLRPAGLFGPCLVIGREDYFRAGGHAAVRDKILENYSLARPLAEQGVPVRLYGGHGAVSVRLYPGGVMDAVQGWTKSFALGAGQTPPGVLAAIVGWISGQILCTAFLAQALALRAWPDLILWGAMYVLLAGQTAWHLGRIGAFKWYTAVLFPVFLIFFLAVFSWSTLIRGSKKGVIWKGRDISQGH
jgi:4,4'-diaponeurosporenoate glycosyltransferase